MPGHKPGRNAATERPPEHNNPRRIFAALGDQMLPGSFCIPVSPLLAGLSFALAVPTVINDERIEPEFVEDRYAIEPMRYIARVAMQKEDGAARIGGKDVPAVKRDTVCRFRSDIDIVKARVPWRCLKLTTRQVRKEHHPLLHKEEQYTQQHIKADGRCNQHRNRSHDSSRTGMRWPVFYLYTMADAGRED